MSSLSGRMCNNSFVPVLGRGTAIFSLNGKRILVRHVLHVPRLAVPLYSLRTHVTQCGCGLIGTGEPGFLIYFPLFVLSVDMAINCHLSFAPLGHSAPLNTLHYVQLRCPPAPYPSTVTPAVSQATPSPLLPAAVEDDADDSLHATTSSSPASHPVHDDTIDLGALLSQINNLTDAIHRLTPSLSPSSDPSAPSSMQPTPSAVNVLDTQLAAGYETATCLLSTMSTEEIAWLLHHDGTSFPSVWPCDTANGSDTKTHWSAKELHRIMGCQKFRNYKHLLQVSWDGEWVDGGEFPPSLGSYATIPKAKPGGHLDKTKYKYLNAVHMDIVFGDCVSVGGYSYALILVNRATRYNWAFGLRLLSSLDIISALWKFRAAAGSLARCFYCDCDLKLFGSAISEYLIDNQSKVVAAPAKRQSANGLVESHWKTMVHMAWAYITEKQMPRTFWF